MKTVKRAVVCCIVLMAFAGCGISGHWETDTFKPELARESFAFLGVEAGEMGFKRTNVTLYEDGRYDAEVYYGTELHRSTGDWERYDSKLTFVDAQGRPYTYDIELQDFDKKLRLISPIKGTDVILTLKRSKK